MSYDAHDQRHRLLYPELFDGLRPTTYPLTREFVRRAWRQDDVDERWLRVHVHKAAPTDVRPTWLYVTCGLSDPELGPAAGPKAAIAAPSGLGCEFRIETTEDADWPVVRLLEVAALQLLITAGRFGADARPLDDEGVLPLHAPITRASDSALHWLLVGPPGRPPYAFQLPSGYVLFLSLLGITAEEAQFSEQFGAGLLVGLLERNGWLPLVDPARRSVVNARRPPAA